MVQVIASNVSAAIAIATHQVHVLPATDFKLMIFHLHIYFCVKFVLESHFNHRTSKYRQFYLM